MRFENGLCYFIKNKNKYGLERTSIDYITSNDFTFLVKCKPDWEEMKPESSSGIVVKNGMHLGIFSKKSPMYGDGEYSSFIGLTFWIEVDDGEDKDIKALSWDMEVDKDKESYVVSMSHDVENKTIILNVDEQEKHIIYDGVLVDYSNAWIWVAAACDFSEYPEEHKHKYVGDIEFVGIYKKLLSTRDKEQILKKGINESIKDKYMPGSVTDFSNQTPYKVKDESGMGHNLTISGYDWT